jgi:DNA end-binding protein Ku
MIQGGRHGESRIIHVEETQGFSETRRPYAKSRSLAWPAPSFAGLCPHRAVPGHQGRRPHRLSPDRHQDRQAHPLRKSGGRRRQVPDDRIAKAIEVKRGEYVVFDDEDLDSVKQTGKRVIDLTQFVKSSEIEPIWYDKPYYVVPADEMAEDAFNVLRDALRTSGMVGLGQFIMRGRDSIAAIKPCGRGMTLETLRFSDEVRKAAPFFAEIADEAPDQELLDLAHELISRKTAKFEPDKFVDHYSDELRAMIAQKSEAHQEVHVEDETPKTGAKVIDLVEALRRSVAQNSKAGGKDEGGKTKAKRRAEG